MAYDLFLAVELRCMGCGAIHPPLPPPVELTYQNPRLHDEYVFLGDPLPFEFEGVGVPYEQLRPREIGSPTKLLTPWLCGACVTGRWALVTLLPAPDEPHMLRLGATHDARLTAELVVSLIFAHDDLFAVIDVALISALAALVSARPAVQEDVAELLGRALVHKRTPPDARVLAAGAILRHGLANAHHDTARRVLHMAAASPEDHS